jgi:sensor histidine kinase YesM
MKQLFEKTYSNPYYRIGLHVFFWFFLTATNYYFNTISFNPVSHTPASYLLALKNTVEFSIAFYSLMYWILPVFIAKRRWIKATVLLLLWVILIASFDTWADQQIFNHCQTCATSLKQSGSDYYNFLQNNFSNIAFARLMSGGLLYNLIVQLSLPIAVKLGRNYFRQTVQQLQLAKDNLQLEFNFLKSQVNPHFLFNTLNNIYSLVVNEKKEQAAATIARLSDFMRYALYETGDEKILLEKEVQLLKDYIELEKLRLNETEVVFHYETDSIDYVVPPLLLMPAVENAFKYSSDKKGDGITISIKVVRFQLEVTIENKFDTGRRSTTGGIGLQNLKKRLQHYYGTASSCSINAANGVYLFRLICTL